MKFTEALNEMINGKRVARKCWKHNFDANYKKNWLEFNGESFISGCGEYDMKTVFNNLLLSDDWEIIEKKEKKPSEILLKLKGNERLEKAYSILDEMYEDIKKLKEK
jgi:hypothetical protein